MCSEGRFVRAGGFWTPRRDVSTGLCCLRGGRGDLVRPRGGYRVGSARLRGWDYGSAGWYFVTVCTRGLCCWFGGVVDGEVCLSETGEVVADELRNTERIRSDVVLDRYVVMPNHLHAIIMIKDETEPRAVGPGRVAPAAWFPGFRRRAVQIGLHQKDQGERSTRLCLANTLPRPHNPYPGSPHQHTNVHHPEPDKLDPEQKRPIRQRPHPVETPPRGVQQPPTGKPVASSNTRTRSDGSTRRGGRGRRLRRRGKALAGRGGGR